MYVYIFQEEWLTRNLTNILESGSLRVLDMQTGDHGPSKVNTWGRNMSYLSVTILPVFGGKCDSENLVGSDHKQPWRPPAANMSPL